MTSEPQSFDRVISSMCTDPHPAAREAATRFIGTNPGDPASFPTVASLESTVIDTLGEMTTLANPYGYVATGGSEANIQAVRGARNVTGVQQPNIVVPASAHFSFEKAADLLAVEYRETPVDDDFRAQPALMADRMDEQTIMAVGVAGTTEYGRVDPIPAIAEEAAAVDAFCHVDAAWGGFLLPFADEAWDFGDAPIDTMTIDPHKLGRAPIPAGGFLSARESIMDALSVATPYLEDGSHSTLSGTRSGAGVAGAHAALFELWPDGYEDQAANLHATADWIAEELADRGFPVVEPTLPIVAADISSSLFEDLRDAGWRISRTEAGELRIVCMPHVTESVIEDFLADLDRLR